MKKNIRISIDALKQYSINAANRGLNGEVKTGIIGGVPRVYFSSQSMKSAAREIMAPENIRTNYLLNEIIRIAVEDLGLDEEKVGEFGEFVIAGCEFKMKQTLNKEVIQEKYKNGIGMKISTTEVTNNIELNEITSIAHEIFISDEKDKVMLYK